MSTVVAYLRVSTDDQTTEAQKHTIGGKFKVDRWFTDEATSGAIRAQERAGFSSLLDYVREGDTVVVAAIDRLGRDTINVLEVVKLLQVKGVTVISMREGFDLSTPIGNAMLAMLSAVAELERSNIKARQMAGIERAKAQGKALGRKKEIDDGEVVAWRKANSASIKATADHFGISLASVKRACKPA
ncbi:MAG: recombinase family protein [Marinospirillum sp.]|uniref:recombinase family protein n=1 Tax=Marinospirillum sp. TaxID=2183934 RepID=UPI0019E1D442|nr:recombinase family protein [Marinospirillum sp.]MBE0508024.1 recombinase family protein [Marinospirillum sp.]